MSRYIAYRFIARVPDDMSDETRDELDRAIEAAIGCCAAQNHYKTDGTCPLEHAGSAVFHTLEQAQNWLYE